jgi:hypothetical protein
VRSVVLQEVSGILYKDKELQGFTRWAFNQWWGLHGFDAVVVFTRYSAGGRLRACFGWKELVMPRVGSDPRQRMIPGTRPKPQTVRQVLIVCSGCGAKARMSRVWLSKGFPTCACGKKFRLSRDAIGKGVVVK